MRQIMILGVTAAAAAVTGACSDDHGDDDDGTSYNCLEETRADEFVLGLTKPGEQGVYEFKLLSADPAPPARGDNLWQLEVSTIAAPVAPVSDATLRVTPFMPDHSHGSGKTVLVTPMTAGQYQLEPVNLWMPGLWEVTIQAEAAQTGGTQRDRVVFRFCLPS
ncbi:MAG TPA: FixH family protein [Kofleriaceae bacterium]|nr:FixH family protein [Kofleriaceae bacterium]